MPSPHNSDSTPVVVGIVASHGSEPALRWAAETAAQRHRRLRIVHGIDLFSQSSTVEGDETLTPAIIDEIRGRGATAVFEAAESARRIAPDLDIETEVSDDSPARLLIEQSKAAHLTVLGVTPRTGTFAHLGSTLLAVTSHGHGSVVVVRPTDSDSGPELRHDGPVVVGIDGSPVSEAAVAAAFAEASVRRTDLVAVHCGSDRRVGSFAGRTVSSSDANAIETAESAVLAERLAGWQDKYPEVTITRKVYLTGATHHLTQWSNSAQLVVVGNRGRGGFTGLLLGSTSNFLVQHAHCPVLVAHSD
ncbi:universal stress protein [Nocardia sp.]|uniref:universal stress protein n=1 Tax=Nocardia sp. TaxID=1821 RepID=UPI00258760D1|nr:universal stress protein [Nocardia sp.]